MTPNLQSTNSVVQTKNSTHEVKRHMHWYPRPNIQPMTLEAGSLMAKNLLLRVWTLTCRLPTCRRAKDRRFHRVALGDAEHQNPLPQSLPYHHQIRTRLNAAETDLKSLGEYAI